MSDLLTTPLVTLAEAQGGVVSAAQLFALGFDKHVIHRWVRAGRLHRLYRGVYALGHRVLTAQGRRWAAILAAGDDAVLSHRSAADLLGFWPSRAAVDIIATRRVRQDGIAAHRHRLHPADRTTREGLPVTTAERTLVDLADVLNARRLEQAYDRARINDLLCFDRLTAALDRANGRHGASGLRRLVELDRPPALTASRLEEDLLALVRAAGLPEPVVNGHLNGHQVDFHWPAARLIVETDGERVHGTPRRRAADRRRDAELLAEGWVTQRVGRPDLDDPGHLLAVLDRVGQAGGRTAAATSRSRAATPSPPATDSSTTPAAVARQSARLTSG
jgi:hypothetical protein